MVAVWPSAADPAHSDTAQVLQLFLSPPKAQRLRLASVADGVGERASAALSAKAHLMYMLDLRLKGRPKEALQYSQGLREGAAIIHPLRDVCDGWPVFTDVAATYMDRLPNQGELLTERELEVLRLLARGLSR